MFGRYRRQSDKQRIADAFEVTAGLDELELGPDDDIAPGSVQPVVSVNADGQRQIELMRWGFKLPDRLLFNARSEGIEASKFRYQQNSKNNPETVAAEMNNPFIVKPNSPASRSDGATGDRTVPTVRWSSLTEQTPAGDH